MASAARSRSVSLVMAGPPCLPFYAVLLTIPPACSSNRNCFDGTCRHVHYVRRSARTSAPAGGSRGLEALQGDLHAASLLLDVAFVHRSRSWSGPIRL